MMNNNKRPSGSILIPAVIILILLTVCFSGCRKKPVEEPVAGPTSEPTTASHVPDYTGEVNPQDDIQHFIDTYEDIEGDCLFRFINNVDSVKVYAANNFIVLEEHCDIDNDMINSYKWIFEQIKENDRIPEKVYVILNDVIKLTGNEDIRLLVKGVSRYGAVFSTIEYELPEGFGYVEPVTYEDKYDTLKSLMDSGMLSDMLSETGGALMDLTVDYVSESELRLTTTYKTDAQSEAAKKSAETYAKLFSSKIREVVEGKYDGEFKLTTVMVDNNGSVFYQGEY